MRLSLFFDVEDPYLPENDDAALDVVKCFDDANIRGCFCITGEKCRVLVERGRTDVIEALKRHSLGLHTNTHSVHPTTMEALESSGWEDGVAIALASEGEGVAKFERAFGRKPEFWGGAGFTWGPQVAGALAELGVPSYVYALTEVPGKRIHRFENCIGFPLAAVVPDTVYEKPFLVPTMISLHLRRKLRGLQSNWCGVLMGHPSRLRSTAYFDESFAQGINPESYNAPALKSQASYLRVLKNLRATLKALSTQFQIVGVDDELNNAMHFRSLTIDEMVYARSATIHNIRKRASEWPTHKPSLSTEKIESVTLDRINSLQILV